MNDWSSEDAGGGGGVEVRGRMVEGGCGREDAGGRMIL